MAGPLVGLTPYAHVADVQRSIDFYAQLGLIAANTHVHGGALLWAFLTNVDGDPNAAAVRLMLARADEPVDPHAQAVLFYLWAEDVRALHDELKDNGVAVGEVHEPFYMPAGEFRVEDPDGYVLLIGQLGERE